LPRQRQALYESVSGFIKPSRAVAQPPCDFRQFSNGGHSLRRRIHILIKQRLFGAPELQRGIRHMVPAVPPVMFEERFELTPEGRPFVAVFGRLLEQLPESLNHACRGRAAPAEHSGYIGLRETHPLGSVVRGQTTRL